MISHMHRKGRTRNLFSIVLGCTMPCSYIHVLLHIALFHIHRYRCTTDKVLYRIWYTQWGTLLAMKSGTKCVQPCVCYRSIAMWFGLCIEGCTRRMAYMLQFSVPSTKYKGDIAFFFSSLCSAIYLLAGSHIPNYFYSTLTPKLTFQ